MTAQSAHLIVNECQNSDLFWALRYVYSYDLPVCSCCIRGGGGNSFAVVISVTYKLHPVVPTVGGVYVSSARAEIRVGWVFF